MMNILTYYIHVTEQYATSYGMAKDASESQGLSQIYGKNRDERD